MNVGNEQTWPKELLESTTGIVPPTQVPQKSKVLDSTEYWVWKAYYEAWQRLSLHIVILVENSPLFYRRILLPNPVLYSLTELDSIIVHDHNIEVEVSYPTLSKAYYQRGLKTLTGIYGTMDTRANCLLLAYEKSSNCQSTVLIQLTKLNYFDVVRGKVRHSNFNLAGGTTDLRMDCPLHLFRVVWLVVAPVVCQHMTSNNSWAAHLETAG